MAQTKSTRSLMLLGIGSTIAVLVLLSLSLALVEPISGIVVEFEEPQNPIGLQEHFAYLPTLWIYCKPLGYKSMNQDVDLYVGEVVCSGLHSPDGLASLILADLSATSGETLWVRRTDRVVVVAWPCSGGGRLCEPVEHAFVLGSDQLDVIHGELMCRRGRIVGRTKLYEDSLRRYGVVVPPVVGNASCFGNSGVNSAPPCGRKWGGVTDAVGRKKIRPKGVHTGHHRSPGPAFGVRISGLGESLPRLPSGLHRRE